GNPLLASLGRLGRDFSDMVIETEELATAREDLYHDCGRQTLLQALQSDILNLSGADSGQSRTKLSQADKTVQIHSCHSPMREIEVLHDQILALLEQQEGLEPRDILVMTPDIEVYAPYITTVFEGCQDAAVKIPFSIADRSFINSGEVVAVLLKLLSLPESRLSVVELLDILESTPVCKRFNLSADELTLVRSWLEKIKVCWGLDQHDRTRYGLPAYNENSILAGLHRLLLGYAMPAGGEKLFNGKSPYPEIEGASAVTLGKFCDYISCISVATKTLQAPATLSLWGDRLRNLISEFIVDDKDYAYELSSVVDLIMSLDELEDCAGFHHKVSLKVVYSWISERIKSAGQNFGFMTGGVTFCAMLPMRSIPFKVIALIGMNDGAFPRQSRPPGFDLVALHPQRGDRSLRDEDRYLFLEALLSARSCFYISYIGQSIKDNSDIPPSVLVSEFMDTIELGYFVENDKLNGVEASIITRHRLQAFNYEYFNGSSDKFSYSALNCSAQSEKQRGTVEVKPFLPTPLDDPSSEWLDVSLTKLLRFYTNPAKFFLENRLQVRLQSTSDPLVEREPFAVTGLEAYALKEELLQFALAGKDLNALLPAIRARGILPPAKHGELLFADTVAAIDSFATTIKEQYVQQTRLEDIDIDLHLGKFHLSGRLNHIWSAKMVRYRCANLKAKDLFRTWIEHLLLNVIEQEGFPLETS
ncbi:MAG: exodeoxyribonuclease V subunit gamma, partial [Desulfuromonadales bacterium]|nr:exodeoxyribonuclease V subunit gamma [Desulfuromonadales bacterium]